MTVSALLEQLRAVGVELWFEGNRLRFRAPRGRLTPELRDELTAAKEAVIAHLRTEAREQTRTLPLSYNQRALWLASIANPESTAYHVAFAARVLSVVDVTAMRHALQGIVDRHEVLAARITADDGRPTLHLPGTMDVELVVHDVHGVSDDELQARVDADYRRPFDFARGPLFRTSLYSRTATEHVLLLVWHHTVVDGWSIFRLLHEFGALYREGAEGLSVALAREMAPYTAFIEWQEQLVAGPEGLRLRAYWERQLAESGGPVELPPDRPRDARRRGRGETLPVEIPPPLCAALRQLARITDTTLFVVLLAAFKTLLFRHTGTADIVVGTPTFGRSRPEFAETTGPFINTVPMRSRLSTDESFRALISRLAGTVEDALDAQDYPLAAIVASLGQGSGSGVWPPFGIAFGLQRFDELRALETGRSEDPSAAVDYGGLRLRAYPLEQQQGQFDLGVELFEWRDTIRGELRFDADLYDRVTVESWRDHFLTLLESAVAAPDSTLGALRMVSAVERQRLVETWNQTATALPDERVFTRVFEARARRVPGALAVTVGTQGLTYRELDARANQLARRLGSLGVGRGVRVGVLMTRTPSLVVTLLAIQKARGTYVPLDPSFPTERLRFMVDDSAAALLVCDGGTSAPAQLLSANASLLNVDEEWPALAALASDDLVDAPEPADAAYVIYTSGSTGRPNGVAVSHGSLLNFLWYAQTVPGLASDDVVGGVASVSFDISGFDFYAPLVVGARLEIVDRDTAMDGQRLAGRLASAGVTTMVSTPATYQLLLAADWHGGPRFRALCGGERWTRELADALLARAGEVWNLYGPTETTIWSTAERIVPGRDPITMGRPLANTRAYVVEPSGELAPTGVVGELWIGGAGVAIGYHGRESLTAERFRPDPFGGEGRVYRTGDLARWRANGRLEYVGRMDHQVKIRGYRIELGEIEAVLSAHDDVAQAVVNDWQAGDGEKTLVAYVVPRRGTTLSRTEMRAHVRRSLPEHMVPSSLVCLEALPLTPTGKVDRRALPAPDNEDTDEPTRPYEAPATPTEVMLSGVWRDVLGVGRVGRDDHFFELGGHSLLIIKLLERLRGHGLAVDVREVFAHPVLSDLAARLDQSTASAGAVLPTTAPLCAQDLDRVAAAVPGGLENVQDIYPLMPAQEGLLVYRLDTDGVEDSYVARVTLAFDDRRRLDAFLDAVRRVMARHDALRTLLLWQGLASPVQAVLRSVTLPVHELEAAHADALATSASVLPPGTFQIDLTRAPLLRAIVASRAATGEWLLCLVTHHIITDHLSVQVLVEEVRELLAGRGDALPEASRYGASVAFARAQADAEHVSYFKGLLGDMDEPTVPFGVSAGEEGHRARLGRRRLDEGLAARLRTQVRRLRVSSASVFHAALAVVLARCCDRDDVVFGTVLSGRSNGLPGVDRAVGMFVNALPLRLSLATSGCSELCSNVNRQLSDLLHHEHASLALAKSCSGVPPSLPLFTTLFNYRRGRSQDLSADGRSIAPLVDGVRVLHSADGTMYPIHLAVDDLEDAFWISAQTASAIDPDRVVAYMERAIDGLVRGLERERLTAREAAEGFVPAGVSEPPPRHIGILPDAERTLVVHTFNDTAAPYPSTTVYTRLFEDRVRALPQAIAVSSGTTTLTYSALNARVNQLAALLRNRGAARGAAVGVCLPRSVDLVTAMLAIFKLGAIYAPLDPEFPTDRLRFMVEDTGARVLVTAGGVAEQVVAGSDLVALDLEREAAALAGETTANPADAPAPEDPAYVIYTSGSTGRPKGVMIAHGALVNHLWSYAQAPGIASTDVLAAVASISFDISLLDMCLPLLVGARVEIVDRETAMDGAALARRLDACEATMLQATPATFRSLLTAGWAGRTPFRVMCGGESWSRELAESLLDRVTDVWNLYGPTETTVWSTVERVTRGTGPLSVGRPIANVQTYVVDRAGDPVPIGVAGEILIGGVGVANGYHQREELSAERFVPNHITGRGLLYKTGDLGRWRDDGRLDCLGRLDHQVKVRGFRIELGEIEAVLATHPAVSQVVVHAWDVGEGDRRLVAYVVLRPEQQLGRDEMIGHLRTSLPEYMIPAAMVVMDALPLTATGKVDRKALPRPTMDDGGLSEEEAPATPTEIALASIWTEVLGIGSVGRTQNFFELGGHSLTAVRILARIRETFGVELPLRLVFQGPTVAEMARVVEERQLAMNPGASPRQDVVF